MVISELCVLIILAKFIDSGYSRNIHQGPTIRTYTDCITYEIPEALARNISLVNLREECNSLFTQEMEMIKDKMSDKNVANYVGHLLRGVHAGVAFQKKRRKRSIFSGLVHLRKEIREPPYDVTWGCYARGVHRLKHNFDVTPDMNTYDVIASLHTDWKVINSSHDGPGFFAWHREYLKIMELAIGCPIPYWDVTFEYAMFDPTQSIVWTDKYFGNGYGEVKNGIMKDIPSWIPIVRNLNAFGWLISKENIALILSKKSLYEFTEKSPCDYESIDQYSWECFHKGVHDWISGTIAPSNTTTFDPVFFPLHAYVDKIFETFRQKLIMEGIDPSENYPEKGIENHESDHKTIWLPIYPDVERLTNKECYDHELAALTKYSKGPECPNCAGSEDLFCNDFINHCVSEERSEEDSYVETTDVRIQDDGVVRFVNRVERDAPSRMKRFIEGTGPVSFGESLVGPRK